MAQVISIVNQKGGVGKTTTTVNLAAYLAHFGQRVLLVDLDPQGNATSGLGFTPGDVSGTYELLLGDAKAADVILTTNKPNLSLIGTGPNLAGAQVELVSALSRERKLAAALAPVLDRFDYVLIDNPPSLGLLTINGLVASDGIIVPVQAEYYALEGLGQLLQTVDLVKEHLKPNLSVTGAVITMFNPVATLSRNVLEEMYKHFPGKIFRSVIPRSIRLAEAPSYGKSILDYDPLSKAAKAYERLAREFLERDNPESTV